MKFFREIAIVVFALMLFNACSDSSSDSDDSSAPKATLNSIVVEVPNTLLLEGLTIQAKAIGSYSDGTSTDITLEVVWSSENSAAATVSAEGLISGLAVGSAVIRATSGEVVGSYDVTVTAASLVSIDVSGVEDVLIVGSTQQYLAQGNYDNGASLDITNNVIWSVSNAAVVSIAGDGNVTAVGVGDANITATLGAESGDTVVSVRDPYLLSLAVSSLKSALVVGQQQQYTAMGTYENNLILDVSDLVMWSSTNASFATVSATGMAHALAIGTVDINASLDTVSDAISLEVHKGDLSTITISPSTLSLALGNLQQLSAEGKYEDNSTFDHTTDVNWTSNDNAIATVDNLGVVRTESVGECTVTASLDGVESSIDINVTTAVIESLVLTPSFVSIERFRTQQLDLNATYSDGSSVIVNDLALWSSTDVSRATVTNSGLVSAENEGNVIITAVIGEDNATITFDVVAPVYSAEGDPDPILLTLDEPYEGMVDMTNSYYKVNVTPGVAYTFTVDGMHDDVDMYVYSAENHACYSNLTGTDTVETCNAIAQESSENVLYIRVNGQYATTLGGSSYNIIVAEASGFISESTPSLTVKIPHVGMVDNSDNSIYTVNVTPGNVYTFTLTGLDDDADISVYDYVTGRRSCSSNNTGTLDESCNAVAQNSHFTIYVDGSYTAQGGANYTLLVSEVAPYVSEGWAFLAEGVTHHGMVDLTSSYYFIATIPGEPYTFNLSALEDDATLFVYSADYRCASAETGTTDEVCSVVSQEDYLYIYVEGTDATTLNGTRYDLLVNHETGYISEAYSTVLVGTPYTGMVKKEEPSIYRTAITTGTSYTVTLSNGETDDVDLWVLDSAYATICSSLITGNATESCSFTATEDLVYLYVDGAYLSDVGNKYTLTIE